ncbi:Serine/threonine protein kinase PrkC, regulator of stationary phase [Chitinispirillum alkaliphilum]|nr:Serine/threonine protein kinase PrkC, regulator of stationary phase [Chitinispirillum alkaliphilum]
MSTNEFSDHDGLDRTIDESVLGQNKDQNGASDDKQSERINPYTQPGASFTPLTDSFSELPDGKKPIPLGSGIIDGVLGEGGMARVYKIWNEKLEVYRAVKVFLPTAHPDLKKRFETEIKISAKLHHPNIIEIYNVGEFNGLPYIEMELVEGVSLDDIITNHKKIPSEIITAIGIQVAKALDYAHNQEFLLYGETYKGIIHRDLKPANIIIKNNGIVKLLDFGIARPQEVGLHTVAGNIVGTLPYLSPEQMDDTDIDCRSDIYSLGTILYEGLTGEKTFPQATMTSLMKMKATNSYRKFSSFPIEIYTPLGKIVEKSLSLSKYDRFSTAADFKKELLTVYNKMTCDSPEQLVLRYKQDPDGYTPVKKKGNSWWGKFPVKSKYIAAGAVSISILALVTFISIIAYSDKDDVVKTTVITPVNENDDILQSIYSDDPEESTDEESIIEVEDDISQTTDEGDDDEEIQPDRNTTENPVRIGPTPPRETLIDRLKRIHKSNDYLHIGEAEYNSGNYSNAIVALQRTPSSHEGKSRANILLANAYLETNNISQAHQAAQSVQSNDAFHLLTMGRIAFAQNNEHRALELFQLALMRPSEIKQPQLIRSDILYYTAIIYHKRYTDNPTPESKQLAVTGWENLKRMYGSQPGSARYRKASEKLACF